MAPVANPIGMGVKFNPAFHRVRLGAVMERALQVGWNEGGMMESALLHEADGLRTFVVVLSTGDE